MSNNKIAMEIADSCGQLDTLLKGGKWEYIPETVEFGNFIPWQCCGMDGCKTEWHKKWYMSGYRIENRQLYETIYSCDSDGDWKFEDEKNVEDKDHSEWLKQYGFEESIKTMSEYYKWVAKHGKDPLDELNISYCKKRMRQATIHLVNGCLLVRNPNRLHEQVREYLCLEGNKIDVEYKSIKELVKNANIKKIVRQNKNRITIMVETEEERPENEIKNEIRQKVKKLAKI